MFDLTVSAETLVYKKLWEKENIYTRQLRSGGGLLEFIWIVPLNPYEEILINLKGPILMFSNGL